MIYIFISTFILFFLHYTYFVTKLLPVLTKLYKIGGSFLPFRVVCFYSFIYFYLFIYLFVYLFNLFIYLFIHPFIIYLFCVGAGEGRIVFFSRLVDPDQITHFFGV